MYLIFKVTFYIENYLVSTYILENKLLFLSVFNIKTEYQFNHRQYGNPLKTATSTNATILNIKNRKKY